MKLLIIIMCKVINLSRLILPDPSRPLRGPLSYFFRIQRVLGFFEGTAAALRLHARLVAKHEEEAVGDEVVISHDEVLLGNAPALAVGEHIAMWVCKELFDLSNGYCSVIKMRDAHYRLLR